MASGGAKGCGSAGLSSLLPAHRRGAIDDVIEVVRNGPRWAHRRPDKLRSRCSLPHAGSPDGRLADTDVIALSLAVSVLVVMILPPDDDQKLAASADTIVEIRPSTNLE